MAQLLFNQNAGEQRHLIRKRITNVGTEPQHDVVVRAEDSGIIFTLNQISAGCEVLPARSKIKVNGQSIHRATRLYPCDRIEWQGGAAVFLDSDLMTEQLAKGEVQKAESPLRYLALLQNLASTLQSPGALQASLHLVLDGLVEFANAEVGCLLSEVGKDSGWGLVAATHAEGAESLLSRDSRKTLFSQTILQEALAKRTPVHLESVIGHPWSDCASVIEARIFSAACLPLCVGERVIGAVFLFTRSPGRAIKRETLPELTILAAQAALLLASQAELKDARKENARLRGMVPSWPSMLIYDSSSPMVEVDRKIQKLAATPLSVLILGETGTGKEVVAQELHRRSARAKGPFVAVNCAAIPGTLLESLLFGHSKGAFTGATRSQPGKFTLANGGTLFLDEIGDLPFELQAKLLRVLQEKQVEPLGADRPQPVDVRVISATHQDIEGAVRAGRMRQDLYFRLNGATLKLPPLRDRAQDVPLLVEHFLKTSGSSHRLSVASISTLQKYSWPGNVRELDQVVTRAALMSDGPEIQPHDLELGGSVNPGEAELFWKSFEDFSTLQDAQLAFTREYVQKVLDQVGGNRQQASMKLGVSERTLYRILSDSEDRSGQR